MPDDLINEESMRGLLEQFLHSRKYSTDLLNGLTPEDCQSQSMEDASPIKWHLAHVTWFYEVMVLKQFETNFEFWNSTYAVLFNSYYNIVGDKHPRPKRSLLTRPTLAEVLDWRNNIDTRIVNLMQSPLTPEVKELITLGINHEQQHQELMLTDLQHLFFNNSLFPTYRTVSDEITQTNSIRHWIPCDSGLHLVGHKNNGFHFDNEGPRHHVYIQPCALSSTLITNGDWLEFMHDGGYQNSKWWLDEGWSWVQRESIDSPLYWLANEDSNSFDQFSLQGKLPLNRDAAVRNISFFEAEAFARWANDNVADSKGARLPTEFEWEVFAAEQGHLFQDLFDTVWQWTSSSYSAYPGYRPWSGMAGEYNGKFMVNQMVLKGSSSLTAPGHSRLSYRNFFPTHARWQMTGLRLAKDKP